MLASLLLGLPSLNFAFGTKSSQEQSLTFRLNSLVSLKIFDDALAVVEKIDPAIYQMLEPYTAVNIEKPLSSHFSRLLIAHRKDPEEIKDMILEMAGRKEKEINLQKVSFLIGCLISSGIQLVMEPYVTGLTQTNTITQRDVHLCLDAFALKSQLLNNNFSANDLSALIMAMMPRAVGRMHTLIPDPADGEEWVVNMSRWRKENTAYISDLAQIVADPTRNHYADIAGNIRFYNAKDPIIKVLGTTKEITPRKSYSNTSVFAQAIWASAKNLIEINI
ncbi:MAG: hypothetical protein HC896_05285 [Bacteroidales bacterium]|nr:hypothetical protein [Bacteroidales bacterium]